METKKEQNKAIAKIKKFIKGFMRFIGILILILLIISIIIGSYVFIKGKPIYEKLTLEAEETISMINNNTFKRLDPTVILRKDNTVVREFKYAPYIYVEDKDVPTDVKDAFISIEDKRFYTHPGIDIKANLRAVKALIVNKGEITQGGSTITQQLVKNIFLTNEQSYERKIKEIFISMELERKLDKDKILEYYINNIYFGNGVYGIATASDYYFSKPLEELNLSEISFLVSIPNNPTIYDPIQNKDNTIKRRNLILTNMMEDEIIDEIELKKEIDRDIVLNIKPKDKYIPEDYEVTFVMSSAVKQIMENEGFEMQYKFSNDTERKQYNELFAVKFEEVNERVRSGGYTIISTIDPIKQNELQNSINNELNGFTKIDKEKGIYKTQSAGVTIDNETQELVAIVGGRTQADIANTFNRAFLAHRQPASAIKPIISYGPEIDRGLLSGDILEDKKYIRGPNNHNGKFLGKMTVREALVRSINTIPFELMRVRGAEPARDYMTSMEFSKIVDGDSNAGISIGGFTYGTSPLELGSAFATLANNGNYTRYTGIDKITFNNEVVIYENKKKSKQIYKDGTAYLLTDMLKGVMTEKYGTGYKLKLGKMPIAGKTGTSSDNKDGWFAGYTPYYTTVIWVGNDDSTPIKGLYGSTLPGQIWQNYMEKIHKGLRVKDFIVPNGTGMMYLNPINGYVSETPKKGYTRHELIPSHYRTMMEKIEAEEIERARLEKERKEEEARLEKERLAKIEEQRKQDFKDKYGVDEDVELANQAYVENNIYSAMNIYINSENDYYNALNLLNNAKSGLVNIAVPEKLAELENKINNNYIILEQRKQDMIVRRENERLEAERLEKERLEKLEAERLEKERLEEEARLEAERLEKEKEEKEKENQNNESNQNNN